MPSNELQPDRAAIPVKSARHGQRRQCHHGGGGRDQGGSEIRLKLATVDGGGHAQVDIEGRRRGPGRDEKVMDLEKLGHAPEQCNAFPLGSGDLARRLLEADLSIPDDVGLDETAVAFKQQLAINRIVLRTQSEEGCLNVAEVGAASSRLAPSSSKVRAARAQMARVSC